jgi:hypothetical protein
MGLVVLPLAVLVSLGSLICFIIVLVKLFQEEGAGKGILGLICGIYTLIWGWQNATRLNINTLMLVWTVLIVISIILRVSLMAMSR